MKRLLAAAFAAFHLLPCFADIGELDPTYGDGGVARFAGACDSVGYVTCVDAARAMLQQSAGKTLLLRKIGSNSGHGSPMFGNVRLSRLNADGTADTAFGTRNLFGSSNEYNQFIADGSMAVQPDGKVVIGAQWDFRSGDYPVVVTPGMGVARVNSDGTLDATFGEAGLVQTPAGASVQGIGVQLDGKIVVLTRASGVYKLVRMTSTGALDPGYGTAGSSPTVFSTGGNPFCSADLVLGDDGAIVAFYCDAVRLKKVTLSGQLDSGFAESATPLSAFTGNRPILTGDGAVLIGGGNSAGAALLRILPNGQPDAAWGPQGVRSYGDGARVSGIALRGDGRIVGVGTFAGQVATMRWHGNGDYDASLRASGRAVTMLQGAGSFPIPLADGKLLVAVRAPDYPNGNSIVRLGGFLDVLGNDRIFVEQQYRDFLDRQPDAAGVDYWLARLRSGELTRAGLIETFLFSSEFQSTVAPVVRLYLACFLRIPDDAGFRYWLNTFRNGTPLGQIAAAFIESPEFKARYGSLDNTQFVILVYRNVLGREPDDAGLNYWRQRLDERSITRAAMMEQFSESPEYRAIAFNEVEVFAIYEDMLRRAPDPGGFNYWLGYLDAGNSAQAVIQGFLGSAEYAGRFQP